MNVYVCTLLAITQQRIKILRNFLTDFVGLGEYVIRTNQISIRYIFRNKIDIGISILYCIAERIDLQKGIINKHC